MSPPPAAEQTAQHLPDTFDEERARQSGIPRRVRIGAIAGVGLLAGLMIAAGWDSPVRAGFVFVFMLFGPGLACCELLRVRDPVQQLAIAVGISFGVDTVVATTLLYAGVLSGELAFAIILGITAAALAASVALPAYRSFADPPPRRAAM